MQQYSGHSVTYLACTARAVSCVGLLSHSRNICYAEFIRRFYETDGCGTEMNYVTTAGHLGISAEVMQQIYTCVKVTVLCRLCPGSSWVSAGLASGAGVPDPPRPGHREATD